MSIASLNKSRAVHAWKALRMTLWMGGGFMAAQFLTQLIFSLLYHAGVPITTLNKVVLAFVSTTCAYVLGLLLIVGVPAQLFSWTWTDMRRLVGLTRRPRLSDITLGLIGFGAYFLLSYAMLWLTEAIVPGFDSGQPQNLGFQIFQSWFEVGVGFVIFVLIAPFIEELLFRGFLFTGLRRHVGFPVAMLIVSVLFGLAHGQPNVMIDTFALSLVLCFLREGSQSIWPSIALHMAKNALAFSFLLRVSSIQ